MPLVVPQRPTAIETEPQALAQPLSQAPAEVQRTAGPPTDAPPLPVAAPPPAPEAPRAELPLRVPPAPLPRPVSGRSMGQRLRARSEHHADLPVSRPLALTQRQMVQRVMGHHQAAAEAAERQGLPPVTAAEPGSLQRKDKNPYETWTNEAMTSMGMEAPKPKKVGLKDLFKPGPQKLPKGFQAFNPNEVPTNITSLLQPTTTVVVDDDPTPPRPSTSLPPPPLPPLRPRSSNRGRGSNEPPPVPIPEPPVIELPLVPPPPRREPKPIKLKTKPPKFLEDTAPPPQPSQSAKPPPQIKTRKRSDSSPPPPPDPALQEQWRLEAEQREQEEARKREEELKQEMELEELRKRLQGGSRGSDVDIPDLARRVYPLIRRLLQMDRERR